MKRIKATTIQKNLNSINSLELELTRIDVDSFQIWFKNQTPLRFESMTLLQGVLYKSILEYTKMLNFSTTSISEMIFYEFENDNQLSENYFIEIDLNETKSATVFYIECYGYDENGKLAGKASCTAHVR